MLRSNRIAAIGKIFYIYFACPTAIRPKQLSSNHVGQALFIGKLMGELTRVCIVCNIEKPVKKFGGPTPKKTCGACRQRKYIQSTKGKQKYQAWVDSGQRKVAQQGTNARFYKTAKGRITYAVHRQNYRALHKGTPGTITKEQWVAVCKFYDNRCLACGKKPRALSVDHVIPLSLGGSNSIDNIQPLCRSCNSRKNAKAIDYRPRPFVYQYKLF
jgi:5-methylcytosine-specific restriction endonuclease McrA